MKPPVVFRLDRKFVPVVDANGELHGFEPTKAEPKGDEKQRQGGGKRNVRGSFMRVCALFLHKRARYTGPDDP